MGVATETAGYQLIRDQFVPKLIGSGVPDKMFQGYLLSSLCVLAMVALVVHLRRLRAQVAESTRYAPGDRAAGVSGTASA